MEVDVMRDMQTELIERIEILEHLLRAIKQNGYNGKLYSAMRAVTDEELTRVLDNAEDQRRV